MCLPRSPGPGVPSSCICPLLPTWPALRGRAINTTLVGRQCATQGQSSWRYWVLRPWGLSGGGPGRFARRSSSGLAMARVEPKRPVAGTGSSRHIAELSRSPVRTLSALSTELTQILPSPIDPVFAHFAMALTTASANSSGMTISTRTLGSSTAEDPAELAGPPCPNCWPKPTTSVAVKPRAPAATTAGTRSSATSGLTIAVISFMGSLPPLDAPTARLGRAAELGQGRRSAGGGSRVPRAPARQARVKADHAALDQAGQETYIGDEHPGGGGRRGQPC